MSRRALPVAPLLFLIFTPAAMALNTTPASNNARGWFPCGYDYGNSMFNNMNTALTQQGYDVDYKLDMSLESSPECRPQKLIDFIKDDGIGFMHIATHGGPNVLLVATYAKTAAGKTNWEEDHQLLQTTYGLNGWTECQAWAETDAYKIYFFDLWVDKYKDYNSHNASSVVYTTACDGWYLSQGGARMRPCRTTIT